MSTTVFVRDGTARGNASLCHTCRHAHIQKGYRDSEEEVRCGYLWDSVRLVAFAVRDCTD